MCHDGVCVQNLQTCVFFGCRFVYPLGVIYTVKHHRHGPKQKAKKTLKQKLLETIKPEFGSDFFWDVCRKIFRYSKKTQMGGSTSHEKTNGLCVTALQGDMRTISLLFLPKCGNYAGANAPTPHSKVVTRVCQKKRRCGGLNVRRLGST